MIIDTSYFTSSPLFVPEAVAQPTIGYNTPSNVDDFKAYIDRMEYQFLVNSIGFSQYSELKDQFNEDGTWKDDALPKWKDLVDGKNSWVGLRYNIGTGKLSIIAYYIYSMWVYENYTTLTSLGVQSPDAANSTKVNPTLEHIDKWNVFVEMYQGCSQLGFNHWNPIFFEWNGYPYHRENGNFLSFLGYISSNPTLYDNSSFNYYETKNRFGL